MSQDKLGFIAEKTLESYVLIFCSENKGLLPLVFCVSLGVSWHLCPFSLPQGHRPGGPHLPVHQDGRGAEPAWLLEPSRLLETVTFTHFLYK